ncbi:uncharacterized protein AB675_782 [Cyphellophora attinorum]|uniref:J domain-containing protein n=1 Tax=Cyphellophora attinorum TaxID=1664694 RepID=A0A0N0NSA8_9EURO|nr:uncharacterized protein AB675_782 [Phialophora attinorum]KPI45789.1 hypothetical protein AB675_782 [Phialophora attinorum]
MKPVQFLLLLGFVLLAAAFSSQDHDIFRLKDEVETAEGAGTSFYDFVGVDPSATVDDIKKALRKRSKTLHPDKVKQNFIANKSTKSSKKPGDKKKPGVHVSKGPTQGEIKKHVKEATERYQRLSVIGKILQSREERERYDHFMRHGFPKWRGTGYYYTRFRPGLGTVLLGLFLVGGGGAHYFVLNMNYKQQRAFMEKYIRSARKQAWGDETGVMGIPTELQRQKREMEKQQKKESKNGKDKSGKAPKVEKLQTLNGERRRVTAENGKVLIVDSVGNVYLEEEDEDGNTEELILDLNDIVKPTIRDTAVFRVPVWLWRKTFDPFLKDTTPIPSDEVPRTESEQESTPTPELAVPNLSSSQISDNGFELVDASGVESDKNGGGAKKRRKGKK